MRAPRSLARWLPNVLFFVFRILKFVTFFFNFDPSTAIHVSNSKHRAIPKLCNRLKSGLGRYPPFLPSPLPPVMTLLWFLY